ncbi:MAG: GAF domain-containing protein [Deltaproteobacteria bacterium]|nr:GAF domain-containing protein [Deltaproteobacteria bacterium]
MMQFKKKDISVNVSSDTLRERNRELSILLEMSNYLATSLTVEDLFEGSLSRVLAHFDLEAGRIYLLDETGQYLQLAAHYGMEPEGLERVSIHEGFSGRAARTRSFIAQHVSDLGDRNRAQLLSEKGFHIVLCVPLITTDHVRGVMNLATSKEFVLDQGKIDLLTTVGNQIAVAADNARLYEDLAANIKAITEKKDMIEFFAYSISHDLKSPTTSLYGLTKRLSEKFSHLLGEKGREYCDHILRTAEQVLALVEKINAYIVASEAPFRFEKIMSSEIMEAVRSEFDATLKRRRIKWLCPDALPELVGDRLALIGIFRNLVDNSLKYGGEDLSEIRVEYEKNGHRHLFFVSDDGVGLGNGDNRNLFKLFHRNETSKGVSGSGLGLAIIKELTKRHRGDIWVEPAPEKGARFCVAISSDLEAAQ